jgi:deferrochelatase/peroxidase EfeB
VPHVLVMLYARTFEALESLSTELERQLAPGFLIFPYRLTTGDMGDKEPFGFMDGVSQPEIDWDRRTPLRWKLTRDYTNVSALGEFVLGYPNEYGKYTDRPLLDPDADPDRILPLAEDQPGRRDFGRNGTFLVLRDLAQDVRGFWQFVDKQAGHDAQQRWQLAQAMVGRMISGDPIVRLREKSIDGVGPKLQDVWYNQFTFENDSDGAACPFGAHIRRANPRNSDLPYGTTNAIMKLIRLLGFGSRSARDGLPASARFHRLLRRGREYGRGLEPEDALQPAPSGQASDERGLRFVCLGASLLRQFEFVQASWLESSKFDGLTDESDPLVGNRVALEGGVPTNQFSLPQSDGPPRHVCGLPRFVTVRGGAYFFLPGLSALRYIACA